MALAKGEVDPKQLLKELKELTEFLPFPNPALRLQTARVCAGLSAGNAVNTHSELFVKSGVVRALTAQLSDQNDIRKEVLSALVNLSEKELFRTEMLESKVIPSLLTAIRNAADPHHELVLMLLSNLSIDPKAAGQVMGDDPADPKKYGPGIEVMRLVKLFGVDPQLSSAKAVDTYQYIANVLTNLTQIESTRALLLDPKYSLLTILVTQLSSPNEIRRLGTLRTIRNLCFDRDRTEAIISDPAILTPILIPLIGPEPIDAEDRAKMYESVRAQLTRTKVRDTSKAVCRAALELLMLCVHHKPTRLVMKRIGIYYILREYHNTIREAEPDLDEFMEEIIPFLLLDEAPEPKPVPLIEGPNFSVNTASSAAAAADTKTDSKSTAAKSTAAAADMKSAPAATAAPVSVEDAEEARQLRLLAEARAKRLAAESAAAAAGIPTPAPAKFNTIPKPPPATATAATPAPAATATAATAAPATAPLSEAAKLVPVEKLLASKAGPSILDDDAPDLMDEDEFKRT